MITGSRAEAEELAQDAFLKVWERWDRVADMDEPIGYLWANVEVGPYVPSLYAVCYYQESGDANPGTANDGYEYPSRVVDFFPPRPEPSSAAS